MTETPGSDHVLFDPAQLALEGWKRQNVSSEPRLSEAAEIYRGLGYEVLLVPVLRECRAEGGDGTCTACFGADEDPNRHQVIYTRRKPGGETTSDGPC